MSTFLVSYFISMVVFVLVAIISHELGHLVCGIISGYKFLSFRLFSFLWVEENGKIVARKSNDMKGVVVGQCMLRPVGNFEDFRYVIYNLGGGLTNLLLSLILLPLSVWFMDNDVAYGVFLSGFVMNYMFAVANLVPLTSGGIPNDGKNVALAVKSEAAKRALWKMLVVNYEFMKGKRPRDFDGSDFELEDGVDISNYLIAYMRVLESERLHDLGQIDESFEILFKLPVDKMPGYYKNGVLAELIYYYSVYNKDEDKAKGIYAQKNVAKYLGRIKQPGIMRALAAYRFFIDGDREEGRRILGEAKRVNDEYPFPGIAAAERDRLAFLEEKMG